jgi:hypothetical protein
VDCLEYLGSNGARCKYKVTSNTVIAKAAFNEKKILFHSKLDLNLTKKPVVCNIRSIVLYANESWTIQKVDQKYLERSEMWYWRRMEISWTDCVRNEEVLNRDKEERNILQTTTRRKANWTGHILLRKCLLKYVIEGKIEGKIEVKGRRWGRRKQLLDDLKENIRYCKLKEETLDLTV